MKRTSILILGLALAAPGLKAAEAPARFDSVRPLGMGGAFTAVADDENVFNFNPAGMVQRTGHMVTIAEVAVGVSQGTLDAVDFLSDNEGDLTNFDSPSVTPARRAELINEIENNISKLDPRVYAAVDIASYLSGPRFFGLPIHVGFGAFGIVDTTFRLTSNGVIPQISYDVNNDIVIPVSVAKRFEAPWVIPGKVGFGLTGKAIRRFQVKRERMSVLELDDLDAPPIAEGHGFGFDLGFLHQPTDRLNWGLMVRDFLGTRMQFDRVDSEEGFDAIPERDTVIAPETNLGIAYVPGSWLGLAPTMDRLVLAADVRDVLADDEHLFFQNGFKKPFGDDLWDNVHLGAEYRWAIFRLRGGAHQGYPSFGAGIDIPFLKINYAFYSRELGDQAGDRREENHIVSVAVRWGSDSVEGRDRVIEAKQERRRRRKQSKEVIPEADPVSETDGAMESEETEQADEAEPDPTPPSGAIPR